MESDGYGPGRGGVGQIYEVASSTNVTCVTQQYMGRTTWPAGLQIDPVASTTTAWGAAPTNTSTNTATDVQTAVTTPSATNPPVDNGGGISAGAIAGIAVGAAAVVVAIIALILFYMRRKRRQSRAAQQEDVDLIGGTSGGAGQVEPKVVPFRSSSTGGSMPTAGYAQSRTESGYEAGQMVQTDPNFNVHGVDTPGSVPFPTPGSGFFGFAGAPGSSTDAQSEEGDQGSISPYATPVPDRAAPRRGLSDSSGPQNDPDTPGAFGMAQGYYATPPSSSGVASSDTKAGYPRGFPSATTLPTSQHPLPPIPLGSLASPEFRRHTDAGEIPDQGGQQGGVVDLPPLYTDVPARRAGAQPKQQAE